MVVPTNPVDDLHEVQTTEFTLLAHHVLASHTQWTNAFAEQEAPVIMATLSQSVLALALL
jgi:hypothetical protein